MSAFGDLGPNPHVAIYGRDGEVTWEGYIEPATPQDLDVKFGGMILASDDGPMLTYVDQNLTTWRRGEHL